MAFILSLDQGTTSSRALLVDANGETVGKGQFEFAQSFPQPGWVEHDAAEIWDSQERALHAAFAAASADWSQVSAIGITNQRETIVAWDAATSEPICPAIVWQDRRTADRCQTYKAAGKESWIQERTGLRLDPYFSASKMQWIMENVPQAAALAQRDALRFGTIDTWLTWKLTGGTRYLTDASNASRTSLMDLRSCDWDPELLAFFGVPRSALPEICDSSGRLAVTDPAVTGGVPVPITGIAGDQQAALFGQRCFESGSSKCTYGTGCFILMNTGDTPVVSDNQLLSTVAWRIDGKTRYALEGSVFIGGAAVQWLRDQLGIIKSAAEIEALARSVSDSGGVVVVPAFAGLGAPYWDAHARGGILGLTRGSSAAHIARATLEGIACQVTDVVQSMAKDAAQPLREMKVDGGAAANDLLMEIQADLLGNTITRPQNLETTALGAAYLAGLGCGFWANLESLAANAAPVTEFEPSQNPQSQALRQRWRRAIARCRAWEQEDSDPEG